MRVVEAKEILTDIFSSIEALILRSYDIGFTQGLKVGEDNTLNCVADKDSLYEIPKDLLKPLLAEIKKRHASVPLESVRAANQNNATRTR